MVIQKEGTEHSTFVIDADKFTCSYCNGTTHQTSKLGDDPDDITEDSVWAALGLTNAKAQTGTVALCQCGHTLLTNIILMDLAAADGSTTPALTDLDASVLNNLAGWWWCVLQGTDIGKYVGIASNTIATPTVVTLDFLTHTDGDGWVMITNVEPVGWTKITA